MSPKNTTMSLLVVQDLSMFSQIWHGVHEFLAFQGRQILPENMAVQIDILGVFVEPSLLLPDTLLLIHSFGISGVWSLCEICSNLDARADRGQQLDFLIKTLLYEGSEKSKVWDSCNQIFFPAFKESVSRRMIFKSLRAGEQKYSGLIKECLVFNDKTDAFRFEKV